MRRTKCYTEQGEYKTAMTPSAEKMVRQAGVRVARLGARTCAFRAVFAKCTAEQRANRMREVQGPGFEGLPASEADVLAMYGYGTHEELMEAVSADHWTLGGYVEEAPPVLTAADVGKKVQVERYGEGHRLTVDGVVRPASWEWKHGAERQHAAHTEVTGSIVAVDARFGGAVQLDSGERFENPHLGWDDWVMHRPVLPFLTEAP